jgi:FHS family L-fucose permease-like MFS transporter
MIFLKPRRVLLISLSGAITFIAASIGTPGNGGIACLSLVLFFESCIFPTIFALSIRGLGRHTKRGASCIVAAVSGGALFPPILGFVADKTNTQKAMFIPLIGFVIAWTFPIYLNIFEGRKLNGSRRVNISIENSKDAESRGRWAGYEPLQCSHDE